MRWLPAIALLLGMVTGLQGDELVAPAQLRAALTRSVRRIETGAERYAQNRACFSCHHQLCLPVLAAARARGFDVNRDTFFMQLEFTRETFRLKQDQVVKGQGVGGSNTTVAYALMVLEAAGQPPDETTAALVQFLLVRQAKDGSWPAVTDRPPSEGSRFTNAALALRSLSTYGSNDSDFTKVDQAKITTAIQRGRDWLVTNEPKSMEDRVFHLSALVEAGVEKQRIEAYRLALEKLQQGDGSWAQLPDQAGDAYATSLALLALDRAGATTHSKTWQRGAAFLLRTQQTDGSWLVETRSKPIQVFFDNGDPGGKSQFISMTATNWAALALLQALPLQP